jgi:hypothetical protein
MVLSISSPIIVQSVIHAALENIISKEGRNESWGDLIDAAPVKASWIREVGTILGNKLFKQFLRRILFRFSV